MNTSRKISRLLGCSLLAIALFSFSSFINPHGDISGKTNYPFQGPDNRESMLIILEALETGQDYERPDSWSDNNYFYFEFPEFSFELFDSDYEFGRDFEFTFPEFSIDEQFLKELEERMKLLEKKMEERFRELEKRIESANYKI